jgi:integrase/recombinase XerD
LGKDHFFRHCRQFNGLAEVDVAQLKQQQRAVSIPQKYLNKLDQCRYSPHTQKTYMHYFEDFVQHFAGKELNGIDKEAINAYILQLIREKKISPSQQNQRINAIKFYYEKVLGREKEYYAIERPRKEQKLPEVLSKNEVKSLLGATLNLMHKCIISMLYSSGLRRGEVINLRIDQIDSERMVIRITGAKGKKDRYVQLSQLLLELLREYYRQYRPKHWLFEGVNGARYSPTSVLNVVKNAAKKAGIR